MALGSVNSGGGSSGCARENLLDNWYFGNPVNQREVSGTISTAGYFLDRWILNSGTVELTANGLVLNGEIEQRVEFDPGQPTTATVLTTDGLMDANYTDVDDADVDYKGIFTITATGQTIIAAKLELDSSQTLARKDASGNWVLNEIPDYGEQMVRCLRYFERLGTGRSDLICGGVWVTQYYGMNFAVPFSIKRTIPAILLLDANKYRVLYFDTDGSPRGAVSLSGIGATVAEKSMFMLRVNLTESIKTYTNVVIQRTDDAYGSYIDISADL